MLRFYANLRINTFHVDADTDIFSCGERGMGAPLNVKVAKGGHGPLKGRLAAQIVQTIKVRRLTQAEAARVLGVDQPKVSALLRGQLHGFSAQRLLTYAELLGTNVEISVRRSKSGKSRVRISGPGKDASMTSRLLVEAADLKRWAESSLEVQSVFPELVRRLVYATGKQINHAFFPAGKSVQLPGWDGTLACGEATPFMPAGPSGWEFGSDAKAKGKADQDYKKRTSDPRGLIPGNTTFIFVTPRIWTKKEEWVAARRAEGIWKDVRAYDARNLEEWLHLAPAVHAWISRHLGKRPDGVRDLSGYWSDWSQATTPPIPAALVTASRTDAVNRIREWCESPQGEVLRVVAETQNEAVAFFAASLQGMDEDKYRSIAARTIIVEDEGAWDDILSATSSLILLPFFDSAEAVAKARRLGHAVLLPRGRGDTTGDAGVMKLRSIRAQDAVKVWMDVGIKHQQAEQFARDAHNGLAALRRQLSHAPPPVWANSGQSRLFIGAMLAGGWSDGAEADRQVISTLTGMPYEQVVGLLNEWSNKSDPPVRRAGGLWSITNRSDAWFALHRYLEADQLKRFSDLAVDILGVADPQYELPDSERWLAAIHGKVPPHSKQLREGFAQSLAMLGVRGGEVTIGTHPAADYAVAGVRQILERANKDWRIWASISHFLPLFAEAAPDTYLGALRVALGGDEPLGRELFRDSSSDWIGSSSSPHTGVLWSLELLARSPDYVSAAAQLLARLDALDPGGRLGNRPKNSLRSVFLPWLPQTAATVERRLQIIDLIRSQYPEVAWSLMLSLLPRSHDSSDYAPAPAWRAWPLESREDIPTAEYMKTVEHVSVRLLEDAGTNGARWRALVGAFDNLPLPQHEAAVAKLTSLDPATLSDESRAEIADGLRQIVSNHRSYSDAPWAMPTAFVDRLAALHKRFEPVEVVRRFAFLFGDHPQLIEGRERGDFRAWERSLEAARKEALKTIDAERGADGILALVRAVKTPDLVGTIAGQLGLLARDEDLVLESFLLAPGAEGRFASGFCWGRAQSRGREWAEAKVKGRGKAWSPRHRGRLLAASLPTNSQTWTLAAEIDPETDAAYWQSTDGWQIPDEELVAAAAKYIAHGRAKTAVDLLGMHLPHRKQPTLSPEFVAGALDAAANSPEQDRSPDSMFAYHIAEMLQWLHKQGFNPTKVAQLEWIYLPVFGAGHHSPKALPLALSESPELFVGMLSEASRAEGDEPTDLSEDRKQRARRATDVLHQFRTVPGADEHGVISSKALLAWVTEARERAAAARRLSIGDYMIGETLSGSGHGSDGAWPHEAVRDVIEHVQSERLDSGIEIGKYNARGVHSRAPGGAQELAIAAEYAKHAEKCADRWPRTAALLREMERKYKGEAQWHEAREEIDD